MSDTIRVIQYGLGPIGTAIARHVLEQPGLELAGCVDIDPAKAGKDAGEVLGLGRRLGLAVTHNLSEALAATGADLALHTTSSHFSQFKPQILEILAAGLDVVSTSEELSFPWKAHPEEAAQIDAAAKQAGRTVLATGVNPGFLMDTLPLGLTAICQRVDRIDVRRTIDASRRRGPFQAKIGCGMAAEDFRSQMDAGRMGHVGLPESVAMVFDTLGKKLVRYESTVEPLVADRRVASDYIEVPPGRVIGLRQQARAYDVEGEFLTLTFVAALGMEDEKDTIHITGRPDLEMTLRGANGDLATVAIATNAIRRAHDARPGLLTMRDLPIVTLW